MTMTVSITTNIMMMIMIIITNNNKKLQLLTTRNEEGVSRFQVNFPTIRDFITQEDVPLLAGENPIFVDLEVVF